MSRLFTTRLVALLGAVASTSACTIPTTPLSNNIPVGFSIVVQNPAIPIVHNRIMNFRANGDDEHLVLRPEGVVTNDLLFLVNGRLNTRNIHAVIDLEYDDFDDTTKMFMTAREYHPAALFQPVYGCDPETDELQVRLQLVSRQLTPPVLGGQLGIRETVGTYEFRYSPPNNPLINNKFLPVNLVVFRNGVAPTATPSSTTTTTTTTVPPVSTTTTTRPPVSSTTTTVSTTLSTVVVPSSTTTTTSASPTPSNPTNLPSIGKFDFVSCWAEPDGGRTLPALFTAAQDMTLEKCAAICTKYAYFGTQWHEECFCDNTLAIGSVAAPIGDCSDNCVGNPAQKCGGGRRLSLYKNPTFAGPAQPGSIGGYAFQGCVTDAVSARTLTAKTFASDTLTLEACATFCAGYTYFGTEYARECFCGNVLTASSTTVAVGQCSKPCTGNGAQLCGNGDRLSLYKLAPPA